jgi:uncharacterized protein
MEAGMGDAPKMRRGDKQIADRAELERILDQEMVLRLGMVDEGRPYVVPLNFAREGNDIWLHSAATGRKLDCIRANPAVCVEVDHFISLKTGPRACDDWSSRYESVIGYGTAEIVEDAESKLHGLKTIMRKYAGRDDWQFPGVNETAVIRVALAAVTGKRSPAPPA